MQTSASSGPLRLVAHVVIALMGASILYAAWIAVRYWSGIGV